MKSVIFAVGLLGLCFCGLGLVAANTGGFESRQAAPLYWLPGLALLALDAVLAVGYATVRALLT